MAVNFVARKCACGGRLEFDPSRKVWICLYCGTIVEREATFDKIQVDGIESISDVVRQTLMDIANRKLDSAGRNLEDCERKDHEHIGTLLANISYNIAKISAAQSQEEARAALNKVKIYAGRIQQKYPVIGQEEINLYEAFGEGSADVYANLFAVFDTLGDSGRLEYIAAKLKPEEVFSPYANRVLLKIAIKHNKPDMVEAIVRNIGHIDRKSSLQEILDHYPDNKEKGELVQKLFDGEAAEALSKKYFESYFTNSKDSLEMKCRVISLLNTTNIHCSADVVIKSMSNLPNSYEEAKLAFQTVYDFKISDQETEALLVFCLLEQNAYDIQAAFLDVLAEKSVFVVLNGRTVISFLDNAVFSADERVEILRKLLNFQIDKKALDAVYNYYLNTNKDSRETRNKILEVLLVEGSPVSTGTVNTYILKTQTDQDNKKAVIEKIFSTGINRTYLGDLLSEYLLHTTDSEEQKERISDYLISLGFRVDSNAFSEYVSSGEKSAQKLAKMRQLIANGTMVKADTLEQYILSIEKPEDFSPEIFTVLAQYSYTVGFEAYAKFVLCCKDTDKAEHNENMLGALNCDITAGRVSASHCGNVLDCNIAQAYILTSPESYEVTRDILRRMLELKIKLNTDISVNGDTIKFKKYVGEHKNKLSPLSLQLCDENKMFSLF